MKKYIDLVNKHMIFRMSNRITLGLLLILFLASSCVVSLRNIHDIDHTNTSSLTIEQMKEAITNAANNYGWVIKKSADKEMILEMLKQKGRRSYMARIAVNYSTRSYSIKHYESKGLSHDGTLIHRTYNNWVSRLENSINQNIMDISNGIALTSRPTEVYDRSMNENSAISGSSGINREPTVKLNHPYNKVYSDIIQYFKMHSIIIKQADREIGQIVTGMTIVGGYRQTGSTTTVSLFKVDESKTKIIVSVSDQKRYVALKTEEWSKPRKNHQKAGVVAHNLKLFIEKKKIL